MNKMQDLIKRAAAALLLPSMVLSSAGLLTSCGDKQTKPVKVKQTDRYEKDSDPDADKRNEDGEIEMAAGDVTLVLPEDFSDYAALEVKEITPPKPLGDLSSKDMKVYDIDLEQFTQSGCYFDIRLPYDDFKLDSASAKDNIGAAYYNPETEEWEPVVFELDEEKKEVVIKTNHLSVYSCFNVIDSGTKDAYISFVKTYDFYRDLFAETELSQAYGMIKAAAENKGKVPPGLFDQYIAKQTKDADILSQCVTVGSFIADNWKPGESDDFGELGEALSGYALALSGTGIALDMWHSWRGTGELSMEDHQRFAAESLKAMVSFGSGFLVSSTGAVVLLAAAPVEGAITSARNAIIANEKDAYRKGYEIFYRDYYPRSVNDWADFLEKARKNVYDENRLMLRIEGEIKRYTEACWNALDETWYFCIGDADLRENIGGHFRRAALHKNDVRDEIRQEISEEFAQEIMAEMIPKALEEVCMRDYLKCNKELKIKMEKLRQELNKKVTFEFVDTAATPEKGSSFAGHRAYLYNEDDVYLNEEWSVRLNDEGKGEMSFSLIGWYEIGKPESVKIFPEGADINKDEPALDFPIVNWVGWKHTIPLAAGVKYEDLEGNYYNATITLGEYELSEQARAWAINEFPTPFYDVYGHEAEDIMGGLELLKEYPAPYPMDFSIYGENGGLAGVINYDFSNMLGRVFHNVYEDFIYDPATGILRFSTEDGEVFDKADYIIRFSYADDGSVQFTGDIHNYVTDEFPDEGSYITFIIKGSKSEVMIDGLPLILD